MPANTVNIVPNTRTSQRCCRQVLIHRADVGQRHVGIEREDLLAKQRRERARIGTAAHEDGRAATHRRILLVRDVHDRIRIRAPHAAALPHAWRETDDRGPGRLFSGGRVVGQANPLADRILVAEVRRGELLIDDGHFASRLAFRVVERPAAHEAHAESVEVPGADAEHRHGGGLLARGCRTSIDRRAVGRRRRPSAGSSWCWRPRLRRRRTAARRCAAGSSRYPEGWDISVPAE